ncbi:uncharacterized protein A1O5_12645 [Cladophialophora psammophila CBS 110553]|uniref:G domain-containing protein n=1 Tax=Cladophialophora psammophila CBS 110553 TaxID=1182543 RepID=W9VLJ8_9EURO|nr:uncharacterized protein A1O5_12645 [Cladophialophora psammophila CBS 110553]EXJ56378.1 hypothetical protein A1O5_12645 [Cladophialophora psammophila CBS 110553]
MAKQPLSSQLGRIVTGRSTLLEDITGASGHSKDASEGDIATEEIQIEKVTTDGRQHLIMDTPGFHMDKEMDAVYKVNGGVQEVQNYTQTWGILYVTKVDLRIETTDEILLGFNRCFPRQDFVRHITFVTLH